MADHIATAQRYRARAAKCELSAKNTSSEKFGECYRLLAQQYLVLDNMEEDCAHRASPFARQDNKNNKQENQEENKQDSRRVAKEANSKADQALPSSLAARMVAVRQLQMTAPSKETVSMPPMIVAIPAAEFSR